MNEGVTLGPGSILIVVIGVVYLIAQIIRIRNIEKGK